MDEFMDVDDGDLFADEEAYLAAIEGAKKLEAHSLNCDGKFVSAQTTKDYGFKSIIGSGGLDIAFSNNSHHKALIERAAADLVLFGNRKFHAASAFIENLSDIFQMARKCFIQLEKDALKPGIHQHSANYFESREGIVFAFEYITTYVQSIKCEDSFSWILDQHRSKVLEEIKSWRILIQGLTKIEFTVLSACPDTSGNNCKLPMHHLLHLHLELRWHLLCLFNAISSVKTDFNRDLEEMLHHNLTELVALAEGVKSEDYNRAHPYFCNCVRQFWLMLQIFADKMHTNGTISFPFWKLFKRVVDQFFIRSDRAPASINKLTKLELCSDWSEPRKLSFSLWLYLHVAPLYGYTEDGVFAKKTRGLASEDAHQLLESILKRMTKQATEDGMREVMVALLLLPQWWDVGMPALKFLLDYYLKNLGSLFHSAHENASSLAVMPKSIDQYCDQINDHLRYNPETLERTNSFHLFLKFLVSQMQNAWLLLEKPRFFNQVKSAICVKINPGRIVSLSEIGFYNLSSLCLTIGLVMELDEMGDKLQGFLDSAGSVDDKKKKIIILSHMALISLRMERKKDISDQLKPLVELLNNSCKDINENKKPLIDVMDMFVESLGSISNQADISLCEVLGSWLPNYLKVCRTQRASSVLSVMVDIASKLPLYNELTYPTDQKSLVTAFMTHLMQYLRNESCKQEPPSFNYIADIAYSVTAASIDTTFCSLYNHFGTNGSVHVGISSRYLSQMVTNDDVLDRLHQKIPNFKVAIIQAWARCCVLDCSNGLDVEAVTRLVCSLPDLENLFGDQLIEVRDSSFPLEKLASKIVVHYSLKQTDIRELTNFKNKVRLYFDKLPAAVSKIIIPDPRSHMSKTEVQSSVVIRMYDAIGNLYLTCPSVMYSKANSGSTLHCLNNTMLLYEDIVKRPTFKIDDKIKNALELHFDKFLVGLGTLADRDEYIFRVMAATVEHFVFSLKPKVSRSEENGNFTNPQHCIERAFGRNSRSLNESLSKVFGTRLLQMRVKTCEYQHASDALEILQGVEVLYGENKDLIVALLNNTLKETLLIVMDFDDQLHVNKQQYSPKQLAFKYFKGLVNSPPFKAHEDVRKIFYDKMSEIYKSKVAFHSLELFNMLFCLANFKPHCQLLKPTLPSLKEQVEAVESQRGRGSDQKLREMLLKLERMLDKN